jgi:hypothetical protein
LVGGGGGGHEKHTIEFIPLMNYTV